MLLLALVTVVLLDGDVTARCTGGEGIDEARDVYRLETLRVQGASKCSLYCLDSATLWKLVIED